MLNTLTVLSRLMLKTHLKVPFNSTAFADPNYEPCKYKIGGDCLDQVIFLYQECQKLNFNPKVVGFDKPGNRLYHAGIIVNDFYLDPAMGLVTPLLVNSKIHSLNVAGYGTVHFKIFQNKKSYILTVISPDRKTSKRSRSDYVKIEELVEKQRAKQVERLSAFCIRPAKDGSLKLIKLKQLEKEFWIICDQKSIKSHGVIPNVYLERFAKEAMIDVKCFVKYWNLARKMLYGNN